MQVVGGGVYDRFDEDDSEGIYGGSLFLTGRTMVGPLTAGCRRDLDGFLERLAERRAPCRTWHHSRERHLPLSEMGTFLIY